MGPDLSVGPNSSRPRHRLLYQQVWNIANRHRSHRLGSKHNLSRSTARWRTT